jgi:hypothetical protein
VLSDDYFTVEEDKIRRIESVLTIVGGEIVLADQEFTHHQPDLPPVSPDWSPVGTYGGYHNQDLHPGMPIEAGHSDRPRMGMTIGSWALTEEYGSQAAAAVCKTYLDFKKLQEVSHDPPEHIRHSSYNRHFRFGC